MKMYGPYKRKDGRMHVIWVDKGKKQTQSYPRFLMEQVLGRKLESWEEVDHINNNFTDNRLENLQVISKIQNHYKELNRQERKAKTVELICSFCGRVFTRPFRTEKRRLSNNKAGPYCSKQCVGKVHH